MVKGGGGSKEVLDERSCTKGGAASSLHPHCILAPSSLHPHCQPAHKPILLFQVQALKMLSENTFELECVEALFKFTAKR
jgi:hypothetical protein